MFRQYRPIEHNEFIIIGADTSSGGTDFSTAQFLSKTKLDVPLVYHSPNTTTYMTDDIYPVLERICDVTGIPPVVAYETNNGGSFELERLARLNKNAKFRLYMQETNIGSVDGSRPKRYGFTTSSATRPVILQDLKEAIDNVLLKVYDKQTVSEMFSFIVSQKSSSWRAEAERLAHDDLIMALAIAWHLYQQVPTPNIEQVYQVSKVNKESIKKWSIQ